MKIAIDLDPLCVYQLRQLIGDGLWQEKSLVAVVEQLCNKAADGVRREGSWEREWIERVFGEIEAAPDGHLYAMATAQELSGQGWIPRVVRGDLTIAHEGKPAESRWEACAAAARWLERSGLKSLWDAIKDLPRMRQSTWCGPHAPKPKRSA